MKPIVALLTRSPQLHPHLFPTHFLLPGHTEHRVVAQGCQVVCLGQESRLYERRGTLHEGHHVHLLPLQQEFADGVHRRRLRGRKLRKAVTNVTLFKIKKKLNRLITKYKSLVPKHCFYGIQGQTLIGMQGGSFLLVEIRRFSTASANLIRSNRFASLC